MNKRYEVEELKTLTMGRLLLSEQEASRLAEAMEKGEETKKEPTTAKLFATVAYFVDESYDRGHRQRASDALAELERRMGAMARVMRTAADVLRRIGKTSAADPLTGDQCRDLLETREALDSALTDAPPVFTLEEVTAAVLTAWREAGSSLTVEEMTSRVCAALRSTGGKR